VSIVVLHVAVVFAPFLALPLAGWLGARGPRAASLLAIVPAALTAYFVAVFGQVAVSGPVAVELPWAPALGLNLAFQLDGLALLFATLVTAVGALVVLYAARYLAGHPHAGRFHAMLFAFMGAMVGLVVSDNLLLLFVFWELTGFTSYLLIGFEHERPDARRAALQALLVTGGGGLALLAAAVVLEEATDAVTWSALSRAGTTLAGDPAYGAVAALVLLAAFTKSAQFPFHFWLPNAMQAPTPVSAYLHAATMVKAGVYLIARATPLLGTTAAWTTTVAVVGAVTMLVGAYRAVLETDLKRVLAYSTISALGVLVLGLGIGTPAAVTASLVYLVAHAAYKGALFFVAGAVDHATSARDVTRLGGLGARMPATATAALLAAGSMAGAPLLFGFVAKELVYEALGGAALAAAVVASALLGAAGFIAGLGPFLGRGGAAGAVHEAPPALWAPALVLGVAGLALGLFPALLDAPLALAGAAVLGRPAPLHLAAWPEATPALALSLVTLAGAVALFAGRATIRRVARPLAFDPDRGYAWMLARLDAVSGAIAPALQGASLRTYALVIVTTAVVLVGAGLATGRVLPARRLWTPIVAHEAVIVALVVAAAVSAVRATSAIPAVLSLGAVGYGIALLYALYGAPDLAMTQFAVETLTVVIFLLVFRQIGAFGDLSSRRVRARDAAVAATVGALITTLVLFIGASGTTSRLASYFAAVAPSLGHGRNVVNVILVDFRALDTLGEITVLVIVAVGVRALLTIGAGRRS
jgi:multicomponent Na+:H+ antiporter subunit A